MYIYILTLILMLPVMGYFEQNRITKKYGCTYMQPYSSYLYS